MENSNTLGDLSANSRFIRDMIGNLSVELLTCSHGRVYEGWKEEGLIREFSKIYFIREGAGKISIEGVTYDPKPGQLIVIPQGKRHSFDSSGAGRYKKYYCHFKANAGTYSLFDVIDCAYMITVADENKVVELFENLLAHEQEETVHGSLMKKSEVLRLLAVFLEQTEIRGTHLRASSLTMMNRIADYIDTHVDQMLTVEALAQKANLHPSYFCQLFKKTLGMSPVRYINHVRMEKAKKMLSQTDLLVGQIAERTGFLNVYYFSTSFKKQMDMTPSNYRKLHQSDESSRD